MTEPASDAGGIALVGRDREAQRLAAVTPRAGRPARVVALTGEAGIGKTALWRAFVDEARSSGIATLVCRPAADELPAPLLGLIDLFDGVAVAPGTLEAETDRFDRGRAVLASLRDLVASDGPVVVAIDDVQWLDPVSEQALRYAVRRLDLEPVTVLVTARAVGGSTLPSMVVDVPAEIITVDTLPMPAIRRIVGAFVPRASRPRLERIYALSAGNPLHAIELARSADRLGDELDRRVPPSLTDSLAARLRDLPERVSALLEVAAALGPTSASELERITDDHAAIADALDLGLLSVDDALHIRITHPLLASVVVAGSNPVARRDRHRALADQVADPDARARHLALSCDEPDAAVAAELEGAAARAGQRGAAALAADLAGHSLRVTPIDDHRRRVRRSLIAISHRAAAGETDRAIEQSDALLALVEPGPTRVDALTQRVVLDCSQAEGLLTRAAAEAGDDPVLLGGVLELHAWTVGTYQGDLVRATALADRALALALGTGDPSLEMMASTTLATTSLQAGIRRDDLMARALAIAETQRGPRLGRWPQVFHARHAIWDGHLDAARIGLEAMQDTFARSGTEFQRPYRLLDLARLELAAGNLARAEQLTADGLESATDAANDQAAAWLRYPQGLVAAHRGDERTAEAAADAMGRWGREHDERPRLAAAHHVRGLAALAGGDGERATAELAAACALAAAIGHRHPGALAALPDAIDAATLTGDVAAANDLAAALTEQATGLQAPWVDAAEHRGRGLAALAVGDPAAAELLGGAASAFDALGYRLDAARTRLAEGRALRRSGLRVAAASAFASARASCVEMGAHPWADQAANELGPTAGGRRHATDADDGLTPTEHRIVALVTAGQRNREVAAELFVSVATVEAHLTRIYRKLGVRSRTELTHQMASSPAPSHEERRARDPA